MMAAPLLATKLYIPPVRPDLVSRPRLIERLNAGLRGACKLALISSPPGFGKTTLLGEWIHAAKTDPASPLRFAWVSMGEDDNDLARCVAYWVAALQTVDAGIGASVQDLIQAPRTPLESILTGLINDVAAVHANAVLVLDDYHVITARPVHDAVEFLLDHMPPNLRLVIATRADPPLSVARLRARGQLVELRQADLRFTPDEAAAFLGRTMDLKLEAGDIAALASRTEGWIAGLQMAALAMLDRSDPSGFVAALTGSQRYILDYLIEEVFQKQAQAVQSFLLQTSILDRMCGPLCDAVVERVDDSPCSGQEMLARLERANLFIFPLDDHQRWYRYHRLFADLLQARLQQQTGAQTVASLHHRASAWYEENGLQDEAIEHALAAQDFERAARLIERAAEATLMRSQVATLSAWVKLLPDSALHARPRLRFYQAAALLLSGGSSDAMEAILRDAEQADSGGAITGQAAALRALAAAYQGDAPRVATLARQALELLPQDDLFMRAFAIASLGVSYLWGQDLETAIRTFEEGARIGEKTGNVLFTVLTLRRVGRLRMAQARLHEAKALFDRALELAVDRQGRPLPIAGMVLAGLGYLSYEWNDLAAAGRYLAEGIELARGTSATLTVGAHLVLARVRQAQGDMAGAREALKQAERLAARTETVAVDDMGVAMSQAAFWIALGELGPAMAWAGARGLDKPVDALVREAGEDSPGGVMRRYEIAVLARLMLAQNRAREALQLLDAALLKMEREGRSEMVIGLEILRARAFQALDDPARSFAALERALTLAEPSGYIRTFVDEGEPLGRLIASFRSRIEKQSRGPYEKQHEYTGLCEYTGRILAAFSPPATSVSSPSAIQDRKSETPGLLSAREMSVLRLLPSELSTAEMADELVVSVNTLRTHLKSIYDKLGAHSRYEAIARAKELGLL